MKHVLIFVLAASCCAFAQEQGNVIYQTAGRVSAAGPAGDVGWMEKGSAAPVLGAPYSATITNESIQTLADGNRIVQSSTGTTARDSQGRTRRDATLPAIGNLSATNAPHLVFIEDPVAKTSYILNLADKTAQKLPAPPAGAQFADGPVLGTETMAVKAGNAVAPLPPLPPPGVFLQRFITTDDKAQVNTEDLGSETMEGIFAKGVRTTRTIPAGEIGNEKAIEIVTEVWTSPDLKTIIYSKRSDPRMGEQTFQLKNIVRAEPDASLFTVPADFKMVGGPQRVIYRPKQ